MPVHSETDEAIGKFTIDNGRVNIMSDDMYEQLFVALSEFLVEPTSFGATLANSRLDTQAQQTHHCGSRRLVPRPSRCGIQRRQSDG